MAVAKCRVRMAVAKRRVRMAVTKWRVCMSVVMRTTERNVVMMIGVGVDKRNAGMSTGMRTSKWLTTIIDKRNVGIRYVGM